MGVLARSWPAKVRVVVFAPVVTRSGQVIGGFEPAHLRLVESLRKDLVLEDDECIADVLVACGTGDALSDHAAACSARFERYSSLKVVVFTSAFARELATHAGLLVGTDWSPLGALIVPALTFEGDHQELARSAATILGIPHAFTSPVLQPIPPSFAGALASVLGKHNGYGVKPLLAGTWRRGAWRPLLNADVERHLLGEAFVAPFHPRGFWPYVVIDVDRHNALQEKYFDETCEKISALFPNSFVVTSSFSGGRHYYVRLPPDVHYDRGALIVCARLAIAGLRWVAQSAVGSERAEVPEQPVRLPFGEGSSQIGSLKPRVDQLTDFIAFARRAHASDFEDAHTIVARELRFRGKWSHEKREKLRRFLLRDDVGDRQTANLPESDPWTPYLSRLTAPLRAIAQGGIPSHGTRTRWTLALIKALSELVEPDLATHLMIHWLRNRAHASEDIALDLPAVEQQTREMVMQRYKKLGVPLVAWVTVSRSLDDFFRARRENNSFYRDILSGPGVGRLPASVRRTAFFILQTFYRRGQRERDVGWREFARVVGKNHARASEWVLSKLGWLVFLSPFVPEKQPRHFALSPSVWVTRPTEPLIYAPVFDRETLDSKLFVRTGPESEGRKF